MAAALTSSQTRKRTVTPAYLVSVDDLWDWERGEVTALARRFLSADALEEFSGAILNAVREYCEEYRIEKRPVLIDTR